MPNLEQSIQVLIPLVTKKTKHRHYDHVCRLTREYYRPLSTGHDADHLIKQFNLREDEAAYKQRLRLTQLISPAITNTLMAPARKIPKVRPVVNTAKWPTGKEEGGVDASTAQKREQELTDAAAKFYGGKGVDHFFGSVLLDQGAIDPNAFCMVLFGNFDNRIEKAKPYPSIISCEDAWNFQYLNGDLQWLLVHRDYEYETSSAAASSKVQRGRIVTTPLKQAKKAKGHAWWLYTATHQIMLRQVDKGKVVHPSVGVIMDANGKEVKAESIRTGAEAAYWLRVTKDELYEVAVYEHKAGAVQGFRIGFIPDQRTKGETMVNLWHSAMPYLLKGVKATSELDISASLHAFLQKFSYENPCRGYRDPKSGAVSECNYGSAPDGTICKECKGTGVDVHRSGQDHITLAMPRSKDEAFDLSSLTHYVQLPVEVLKWQDEYVDKLERACYRAVYNSDRFRPADSASTTATGDIIDLQSIYDTLKPVADWYSQSRVLTYRLIAATVVGSDSIDTLEVAHEFPRNMRFETISERVKLLQDMRNAGSSNGAMLQVDTQILEDLYVDDPAALKRAKTMARFNPFIGKSEATVLALISQDLATMEDKVLWTNESRIYAECEARASDNGEDFFSLAERVQRKMIDEVVAEIIQAIEDQAPDPAPRFGGGIDPNADPNPDPNAEPDPNADPTGKGLPASPGDKATA